MRTTKELLEILLDHLERYSEEVLGDERIKTQIGEMPLVRKDGSVYGWGGLCHFPDAMYDCDVIGFREAVKLSHHIRKFLPPAHEKNSAYSWPPGMKEPRIKWLKEQINKL